MSDEDPRKYECPVCLEHLTSPIYQCTNGHLLCAVCIPNLLKCPICRQDLPRKRIRNLEMEKVVNQAKFCCPNRQLGCKAKVKYEFMEDHRIDCLFSSMNFCSYLGIDSCKENFPAVDFVFHLMEKHNLLGEFTQEGTTLDICQSGAVPKDIQAGKVYWQPNFIVLEDNTFFLQTKVTAYGISWMISALGSTDVAKDFLATIKLTSSGDSQPSSLTWQGQVSGLKSKFEDNPSVFTLSFLQSRFYWTKNPQNEQVSLNLQVSITKKVNVVPQDNNKVVRMDTPAGPSASSQPQNGHTGHGLVVHNHVGCDGCHANPLMGPRYKCIECPDFDLCRDCMDNKIHSHHVFLRASDHTMAPKLDQAHRGYRVADPDNEQEMHVSFDDEDWTDVESSSEYSSESDL